ncbi:MAG TPA: alkaline phosphatase family protein, partial [Gemmataceae bacterium]|nr:alkaline phosphatase family protein [Gemmataceae bacterium]
QMRGDYLTRWHDLFGKDGFRRLENEGAWFQNCNYPYANTVTAAGHASLLTGTTPAHHGIIGNDWYDRSTRTIVTSVGSARYTRVTAGDTRKKARGASPQRLLVPTIGDVLKTATGNRARVIGVSLKDRAAILPAGRHADACYWFESSTGNFVSSTYYLQHLPDWVLTFNRAHRVDRWLGSHWARLRTDLDYTHYSGHGDFAATGQGANQGRTFPHPFPSKLGSPYYQAFYNSPLGNELLLDFAAHAIEAEHLGRHDVPDVLCISFSSNDAIGHSWGPDSHEVMDVTLRSDQIVRDLLRILDERVGKGKYILALTADHGVCPLPEFARQHGHEQAQRISTRDLFAGAREFLQKKYGKNARWIQATAEWWVYLNQQALHEQGLKSAEVEAALADWLKQQPGIQTAYTRTQLAGSLPANDAIGLKVQQSFYPERSGDVYVVVKPYCLLTSSKTGTTHGTPYPYDTHVPLLVYGPGIRPGTRHEAVTPQAIAAIFAHALHVPPPATATAPVPSGLFN